MTTDSLHLSAKSDDWDEEDCCYILRELELNAFSAIVSAYRAQGRLTQYKEVLLDHIKTSLSISESKYSSELRRAANDPMLSKISTSLNPSYNCSLEWLNVHATREPPMAGDAFNLVPPPEQLFESENQTTSRVANDLLALARSHNELTQEEDTCLAALLQIHKEPYVPERARKCLLDSERRGASDRLLPTEGPLFAMPYNAAAVGSAPTKRLTSRTEHTKPGPSALPLTDAQTSVGNQSQLGIYKRRNDSAPRGRRKRLHLDAKQISSPAPSEDDIKRINQLIATITKNPLPSANGEVLPVTGLISSPPSSVSAQKAILSTSSGPQTLASPTHLPYASAQAQQQQQQFIGQSQQGIQADLLSTSKSTILTSTTAAAATVAVLPKTSTGAIDSSPEAINEFIARISQQVAEEALHNNPVRRRRRNAASSLSRSRDREQDCARARPFIFDPSINGVKPPRGNPDKRMGSKVARRNPNGLAAHLMSQNHVTHIYQPPRGLPENGTINGRALSEGSSESTPHNSQAMAAYAALQSGVPPLTPSNGGRSSPLFFTEDGQPIMSAAAYADDKPVSVSGASTPQHVHGYKFGQGGGDENGLGLLKRARMSMTTGEYLMQQAGALQSQAGNSRFGVGTGHVTPYNRYRTYANQSPSSARIPVRVLPASTTSSIYGHGSKGASPTHSEGPSTSSSNDFSRFTDRARRPYLTNGRFTPPHRPVSATPGARGTEEVRKVEEKPTTSTYCPEVLDQASLSRLNRPLSTPPEGLKHFSSALMHKFQQESGGAKAQEALSQTATAEPTLEQGAELQEGEARQMANRDDGSVVALSEAQILLELAAGGGGQSGPSSSSGGPSSNEPMMISAASSISSTRQTGSRSEDAPITNGIDPATISLGGADERHMNHLLQRHRPDTSTMPINGSLDREDSILEEEMDPTVAEDDNEMSASEMIKTNADLKLNNEEASISDPSSNVSDNRPSTLSTAPDEQPEEGDQAALEEDVSEFFTSIPPIMQQRRDSQCDHGMV